MSFASRLEAVLPHLGITLRPQEHADRDFARAVYVSHRAEEMLATDWTPDQRRQFLEDQFRLQWQHYRTHYRDAEFLIVEVDGVAAGRLYLFHEHAEDLRIMEIGLLPQWRGQGLGSALPAAVQAQAERAGKYCSIHVEATNPALRLYERLGFRRVKPVEPYFLLEWHADACARRSQEPCPIL